MNLTPPLIMLIGWVIGFAFLILLFFFFRRANITQNAAQQKLLSRLSEAAQFAQRGRTATDIFSILEAEVSKIGYHCHFLTLTPDREHLSITYLGVDKELIAIGERISGVPITDHLIELPKKGLFDTILYNGEAIFLNKPEKVVEEMAPLLVRPFAMTVFEKLNVKNISIAAVKSGSDIRGLLMITGSKLSRDDLPAIQVLANQLGAALENVALYVELANRASALQDERNFTDAVFDASGVLVMVLNLDGSITRINKACEKLTGYSSSELAGQIFWEKLVQQDNAGNTKAVFEELTAGYFPNVFENTIITKDGSRRFVSWNNTAITDAEGKVIFIISAGTDITQRVKMEEDLLRHREHLEELVQNRTVELKTTNDKLAHTLDELTRSNTELEQFAYIASHDLQEPLRMIASYTQLLAIRYQGQLDSDADEFIHFAVDGTVRMQHLINDLLTYSRISTRKKEFQTVQLNQVMADVLKNLQVAIQENNAVIHAGDLPGIFADGVQMTQLFQNLIGNAIKFHGSQPPLVTVKAEKSPDKWTIRIQDNGIGISPKYHERIFEIFQRLNSRAQYPGTGIGLAVCKKIVNRHGGEIWVESNEGMGATFLFTIPNITVGNDLEIN